MIEWFDDFQSSNVAQLGYNSSTQECYVQFKKSDGTLTAQWKYWRVPPAEFEAIHTAPSVGSAVNKGLVRSGLYSSEKVAGNVPVPFLLR